MKFYKIFPPEFLNLKSKLISPSRAGSTFYIYKPENPADEAEFLVKIKVLEGMVFDI